MRLKLASTPLSVLLTTLTLSAALPFSAVVYPCGSVAQAARTFGTDGSSGSSGRSGEAGQSGSDMTVQATKQPVNANLEGKDGGDGEPGGSAQQPYCGRQGRPDHDLEAADGGTGGSGGNGGNGGDGGLLTIYYQDRSYLKNIYVDAAGGNGGQGAYGGRGTRGCRCSERSWEIQTCADGNCRTDRYTCRDGTDGSDGSDGRSGKDGSVGRARLVNQIEPLAGDKPLLEEAIATLATTPLTLSRNLWESRTGIQALLANGSVIDDQYEEYTGRVEQQFQLVWEAARPQTEIASSLTVAIDPQGKLQITPAADFWIDSDSTQAEGLTTYRVRGALLQSEATQLSLGTNSGQGQQLTLNVIDLANVSSLVDTRFHLRYRTDDGDRRSRYITRYDADIPSELITQDYSRFTLSLGRLPIDSQYLRAGTQGSIEIIATRSYAGNTAAQSLSWNGRL